MVELRPTGNGHVARKNKKQKPNNRQNSLKNDFASTRKWVMADAAVAVARGGVGGARPDEARTPSGSARCALPDGIETTSRRGSCEKLLQLQGAPAGEWAGARALGDGRSDCEAGGGCWRMPEHGSEARHPERAPHRPRQQLGAASWDEQQLQHAVTLASGGVVRVRAHRRPQLDEYVLI